MRFLSSLCIATAAVLLSSAGAAQADSAIGGRKIKLPQKPITKGVLLPDLTLEKVRFSAVRLAKGQIQPQVRVKNKGRGRAGRFSVVVHVSWKQGARTVRRRFRSRIAGLNGGAGTLRTYPVINVGRGTKATIQYTVDPIAHTGNDFAPRGYGEVRESSEGNNLLLESRTAR